MEQSTGPGWGSTVLQTCANTTTDGLNTQLHTYNTYSTQTTVHIASGGTGKTQKPSVPR